MKIIGLLSVVLLLVALGVIVATQPQDRHSSISRRAAAQRWTYLLFASSLTIFGSLFDFYLFHSFGPQLGLPVVYYGAVFLGWICLLLTAWIPERETDPLRGPHWRFAFALACCMTVMTLCLAFTRDAEPAVRVAAVGLSTWYGYTLYLLFQPMKEVRFLTYESFNVVSFMAIIGLALIFKP
jgi:hypothetical protein